MSLWLLLTLKAKIKGKVTYARVEAMTKGNIKIVVVPFMVYCKLKIQMCKVD